MLINPVIRGKLVPLVAPIGAAAFTVVEHKTDDGVDIIFATMKDGESGLKCLARLRRDTPSNVIWRPTAARPEEQSGNPGDKGEILKCPLSYKDGTFFGATQIAQDFLETMRRISSLPTRAPEEMQVRFSDWLQSRKPSEKQAT